MKNTTSNSPTNHAQPVQTPEQLSQSQQQELIALRREKAALSQLMWELTRAAAPDSHDIEVPQTPSDPLWHLVFVPSSDEKSGRVRILAGSIKPMTEQEKKRVVRLLRGTEKTMEEALAKLKLDRFPPSYVEKQIETHLVWLPDGLWESVKQPSLGARVKNLIGMK